MRKARLPTFSFPGCKLEKIAFWASCGLSSAFFISLERCSCVKLRTSGGESDDEEKDRPLIEERSSSGCQSCGWSRRHAPIKVKGKEKARISAG